jgi:hypothetical protein
MALSDFSQDFNRYRRNGKFSGMSRPFGLSLSTGKANGALAGNIEVFR